MNTIYSFLILNPLKVFTSFMKTMQYKLLKNLFSDGTAAKRPTVTFPPPRSTTKQYSPDLLGSKFFDTSR
jgi:hypothetical protein